MSLLLDALKKAAQKKAQKNGQPDESVEPAVISGNERKLEAGQQDETALTATETVDFESTQHHQDAQLTELTEMDSTMVEEPESEDVFDTQLDEVSIAAPPPSVSDPTEIDLETHFTQSTEMESTSIGDTEHKEESFDTLLTDVIAEDESSTPLEEVSEQHEPVTEPDTPESTETIEIESIFALGSALNKAGSTAQDTIIDDNDPTKVGDYVRIEDTTEMDVTTLDKTELGDDTELGQQSQLDEKDRTLHILDGAKPVVSNTSENTTSPFLGVDDLYRKKLKLPTEDLTEDDVTQFMGDGISQNSVNKTEQNNAENLNADDTTVTNPESLTMTNFSFDDEDAAKFSREQSLLSPRDLTENDTFSLHEYDNRANSDQTVTNNISLDDIPDDEKSTRINTDSTSTISSIDIEQLTSDGVVAIGNTNTSKTFAPDNYDRTLLNLSEKDVSNIFPGVRPDADTVMTPDYAKRIFLSKSGQVETRYFKLYASIGLILLLSVVTWGLFQLQDQSGIIDQKLAQLKRDPLPGIIKTQAEKEPERLFIPETKESNLNSDNDASFDTETVSEQQDKQVETDGNVSLLVIAEDEQLTEVVEKIYEPEPAQKKIEQATKNNTAPAKSKPSTSTLSISSGSQVTTPKSQLLMQAYNAYEQGNMASARVLYNKVLKLDKTDRDGMLGRAAVHIRENEYQPAINMYQLLLVSNPKDSIAMASLISVANIDPQAGETQLKALLREQPDSPYLHFILGNMYGGQKRWHEAQNAYFEALHNKPDDANYAYNLAVSLEHIGKATSAITFYKKALDNSSNGQVTFDDKLVMQRLEVLTQ